MSTRHLTEVAVNLIIAKLQAGLPAALTDIMVNRNDPVISYELPKDYYIYDRPAGYKTPAVFVIGDSIDFRKKELGANHINANIRINVSVTVDDKDEVRITKKCWRYQAAISEVLDQQRLTAADNAFTLWVVIQRAAYSDLYIRDTDAVFRKEVRLELDCYAVEQL